MGAETLKAFAEGWLSTLGFRYSEDAKRRMLQQEQDELRAYDGPALEPRRLELVVHYDAPAAASADAPAAAEKSNAEKEFDALIDSYLSRIPGLEFVPGLQDISADGDNRELAYGYVASTRIRATTSFFGMWQINKHHVQDALALVVELSKIRQDRQYKISTFKKLLEDTLSHTSRFGYDGRESQFWSILSEMLLDIDEVTDTCVVDDQHPQRNQRLDNLEEAKQATTEALKGKRAAEQRATRAEAQVEEAGLRGKEFLEEARTLRNKNASLSSQFAGAVEGRQQAEQALEQLRAEVEKLKKQHEEALAAVETRSARQLQMAALEVQAARTEHSNVDAYRGKMVAAIEEKAQIDAAYSELKRQLAALEKERDGLLRALETTNAVNGSDDEAKSKQIATLTKQVQDLLADVDRLTKQVAKLRDEKEVIKEDKDKVSLHNATLVAENIKLKALINGFIATIQGLKRFILFLVAKYDYINLKDPESKFPHKEDVAKTLVGKQIILAGVKLPPGLPGEYQPPDFEEKEAGQLLNEFRGHIRGAYEARSAKEGNQQLLSILNGEYPLGGVPPVYFDGGLSLSGPEPVSARKTSDADVTGGAQRKAKPKIVEIGGSGVKPPAAAAPAPSSTLLQGHGPSPVATGALATTSVQSATAARPKGLAGLGAPVVAAELRLSSHSNVSPVAQPASPGN